MKPATFRVSFTLKLCKQTRFNRDGHTQDAPRGGCAADLWACNEELELTVWPGLWGALPGFAQLGSETVWTLFALLAQRAAVSLGQGMCWLGGRPSGAGGRNSSGSWPSCSRSTCVVYSNQTQSCSSAQLAQVSRTSRNISKLCFLLGPVWLQVLQVQELLEVIYSGILLLCICTLYRFSLIFWFYAAAIYLKPATFILISQLKLDFVFVSFQFLVTFLSIRSLSQPRQDIFSVSDEEAEFPGGLGKVQHTKSDQGTFVSCHFKSFPSSDLQHHQVYKHKEIKAADLRGCKWQSSVKLTQTFLVLMNIL